MAFPKSDEKLGRFLEQSLAGYQASLRPMFGCPAWFVGDNMFAGVFGSWINLRLPPGAAQEEIMAAYPGPQIFEPFPGRLMRQYVSLLGDQVREGSAWQAWLCRSYDHAASLPPKPSKKQK